MGTVWQTAHEKGCGYEESRRKDYDGKRRRLPRMDGYSLQRMTIRKRWRPRRSRPRWVCKD